MTDAVVIGAGVIGLATARALVQRGFAPLVVDGEGQFGTGTSSRNSEVVHAGLHHPPNFLKTRLCVAGRGRLYAYCRKHGVPYRRTGKLIVATASDEIRALDAIAVNADMCGVATERLTGKEAAALEPALSCHEALLVPDTGIVDSHALMLALLGEMETGGGQFVPHTRVVALRPEDDHWQVEFGDGFVLSVRLVVNAAGLGAVALAGRIDALPHAAIPRQHLARGRYFAVAGRCPFSRLIYPVPVDGGLGTHVTFDLAGCGRLGPDVTWVDKPDYSVDAAEAPAFARAARRFWPGLRTEALAPGYAGVRPKLNGPGEPPADFVVSGPEAHGLAGLVNLFGIESPGLTASLSLADEVVDRLVGPA